MAFTGKVALITGGGSGMGQLAAHRLNDGGAAVAILDVNEEGMKATAEGRSNVKALSVDISNTEAVQAAVREIEADLGPIDRVVNAAAIMPFGKLLEQDPKLQNKMSAINYGGLINIATSTLPGMLERGRGDFVSFASMAGHIPGLLMGSYCANKAAVAMYTEILYHENRDRGVRFACACPPQVATPLWKQAEETVMPKLVEGDSQLQPGEVLDAIENSLEAGEFWVFPGKGTRVGYRMRRFFPNFVWNHTHKVEGF